MVPDEKKKWQQRMTVLMKKAIFQEKSSCFSLTFKI